MKKYLLAVSLLRAGAIAGTEDIRFEPNMGQAEPSVSFLTRGHRSSLLLTGTGAKLRLRNAKGSEELVMRMSGSNPHTRGEGEDRLASFSNYLLGSNKERWQTGVANYGKVRYHDVYPGVDLVYYGNGRELEYDFVLRPGAKPEQVRLRFSGHRGGCAT